MKQKSAIPKRHLLRHTPGTNSPLGQNAAHNLACRHALVDYLSGAVFTFIPKNACTSLRVSLALSNGTIGRVEDWTWVHKNNGAFSAELRDLVCATSTAVVLRCPHQRLASTFLDKIVSRRGVLWELYQKSSDGFDVDHLTFRKFIGLIETPGFLRSDIHLRPQADFLVYESYDRVFGMQHLSEFSAFFQERTGRPFVDARPFSKHAVSSFKNLGGGKHVDTPLSVLTLEKSKGVLPSAMDIYDDETIERVSKLYACDLDLYLDLIGEEGLISSR